MIVCSAGTGGTITGIARKLKEKLPDIKVSLHLLLSLLSDWFLLNSCHFPINALFTQTCVLS